MREVLYTILFFFVLALGALAISGNAWAYMAICAIPILGVIAFVCVAIKETKKQTDDLRLRLKNGRFCTKEQKEKEENNTI